MASLYAVLLARREEFLAATTRALAKSGVAVVGWARTAAEALEKLDALGADLLVLDFDGDRGIPAELVRHVKSRPRCPHVVVVVDRQDDRPRAMAAGADAVIRRGDAAPLIPLGGDRPKARRRAARADSARRQPRRLTGRGRS